MLIKKNENKKIIKNQGEKCLPKRNVVTNFIFFKMKKNI